MKKITYKNIVTFNLPEHWVVDEDSGVGVFYEQGDDVSTLRLEVLVAKSPKPVDENTAKEMLGALTKGGGVAEVHGHGIACKFYSEEVFDQGNEIVIYYWYVANAVSPDVGQLATFSFTTVKSNKENEETLQIIGMLDREIRTAKFI